MADTKEVERLMAKELFGTLSKKRLGNNQSIFNNKNAACYIGQTRLLASSIGIWFHMNFMKVEGKTVYMPSDKRISIMEVHVGYRRSYYLHLRIM